MSGPEDFVFVVVKSLNPRSDVRRVIGGFMRNSAFGCDEDAGELGTKLLACVVEIAEAVRIVKCGPIEPGWMSGPMRKLMQSCSVVSGRVLECLFWRQMDAVRAPVIES